MSTVGEQAKKKPTPAKKKTAAKTKPAAKPANIRDDWIAKGYDEDAVVNAMEAKPALDTESEIWDAMLERFKFRIVSLLAVSVNELAISLSCGGGAGEVQQSFPASKVRISRHVDDYPASTQE